MKPWREVDHLEPGQRVRSLRRSDLLGKYVVCPHCAQTLKVIDAHGPHVGYNPTLDALDQFFVLTLADGADARFWADHKGVVEPRPS